MSQTFPHMRGDLPHLHHALCLGVDLSPHAWGSSLGSLDHGSAGGPFPTCVGIFPGHPRHEDRGPPFPHMRGDLPNVGSVKAKGYALSPHAWGSSQGRVRTRKMSPPFPTCVGIFPGARSGYSSTSSFPHMRGDLPSTATERRVVETLSPHTWGSSTRGHERSRQVRLARGTPGASSSCALVGRLQRLGSLRDHGVARVALTTHERLARRSDELERADGV